MKLINIIQEEINDRLNKLSLLESVLLESVSNIVYHRTSYNGLISILKANKILLSSTVGTSADRVNKMPYFLSFSRTKNPNLGYGKGYGVAIVFDGKALSNTYKGGAVDYWQSPSLSAQRRADSNEYEDRIYSYNPYMENLDRYITSIDILLSKNPSYNSVLIDIQKTESPLKNKIRIFTTEKDFQMGTNAKSIDSINVLLGDENNFDFDLGRFNVRLLENILTILLIGDNQTNDDNYLNNYIKSYLDRFIALGAKIDVEKELSKIRYKVRNTIPYIDSDQDFLAILQSDIHNLTKSSTKTEINYEVLKLLSDEMRKYKVNDILDLIKAKKGKVNSNKNVDYSKRFTFGYKTYEGYVLMSNDNETRVSWHLLDERDRSKILDIGYPVTNKIIINYLFNSYTEEKAKEILNKILPSYSDDILIDLRGKLVYSELTEADYVGGNIANSNAWYYIDNSKWYLFILDNLDEDKTKQYELKLTKLINDENIKLGFIYAATSNLIGEEKSKLFFEENNIIPLVDDNGRERRYVKKP